MGYFAFKAGFNVINIGQAELIGKRSFIRKEKLVFSDEFCDFKYYLFFFSVRLYYEWGKKYIVAEMDPVILKYSYDDMTLGKFFKLKIFPKKDIYINKKTISDIYLNEDLTNSHFNEIYGIELIPEVKNEKRKRKGK
jgi:hypothetical protein